MADEPKKSNLVSLASKKKEVEAEGALSVAPDPAVIAELKKLLAKAESGELRGIIGFTLEYDKADNVVFNDYVFTGTEILIENYQDSWWMLEKTRDVYKELLTNYENGDF